MAEEPIRNIDELEDYTSDKIITAEGLTHLRWRPGMYIGKLGDGSQFDDGIYILLKEIIDNGIDEFRQKFGTKLIINIDGNKVSVRDFGRGIPFESVIPAMSLMNTSGKFDDKVFKRSIGLNGVGAKAVNALSSQMIVRSFRNGEEKCVIFSRGKVLEERDIVPTTEKNGTFVEFTPDTEKQDPREHLFDPNVKFNEEIVENMLRNYSYLCVGLTIHFNGKKFTSKNGLQDLLTDNLTSEPLYPVTRMVGENIEIAFTHTNQNGEEYSSFVNGQHTTQGGTHQSALREAFAKAVKEFYNRNGIELSDIRNGLVAAIALSVQDPTFKSQTKTALTSKEMEPNGTTIAKYVNDFIKTEVDNFLHKNPAIADAMLQKILASEKERKEIASITKSARERIKKVSLNNKKLNDCLVHLTDSKNARCEETAIFITEGNSASGSITKTRDPETQAVFSLRGKPLNSYGKSKNIVYENEEFALLQAALNIEESLDDLRYNKVIIATDADVDGMHIRMLLLTFFLQFFPDLVKKGHLYILETPLFRVRNKEKTTYCYSEIEREEAIANTPHAEITRFKGLGEIDPSEFKSFIAPDLIRLEQVHLRAEDYVNELLEFYMSGNTPTRQNFIVDNLIVDQDDL